MNCRHLLPSLLAALLLVICMIGLTVFLAFRTPENQVEILFTIPADEAQNYMDTALQGDDPQLADLSVWQENGARWSLSEAELFTAQHLETALAGAGLPDGGAQVLDYSWAQSFLTTAVRLWQTVAAFCLLVLLVRLAGRLVLREVAQMRTALRAVYPAQYLRQNGEHLLKLLIALVPLLLAAALLVRWLCGVSYFLPTGFLPEGSLFVWGHYIQWMADTFPPDCLSPYAMQLKEILAIAYSGACVISALWIFLTFCLLHYKL